MDSETNNNNNKNNRIIIRRTDWRKYVKKIRRKRIRQALAKHRDGRLREAEQEKKLKDPQYLTWLAETETKRLIREAEEERLRDDTTEKWLRSDLLCQQKFNIKKQKLDAIERVKEQQRFKIKQEFEAEQKRLADLKEEEKRLVQEQQDQFNRLMLRIDDYINWKCDEPPMELQRPSETNPGRELCKFFLKTSTCRFGLACSRNHRRPGISNILLIANFFTHIRLEQNQSNEYGNDSYLEYDESDLYREFNEFANDVLTEFEKCGKICQFLVCNNQESHLRGNVYIEYDSKREALKAYRIFHGRYYAGRTINVEFCSIISWKNAICGLSLTKTCPKGRNCNFLHIFKNPNGRYPIIFDKRKDKHHFNSQRTSMETKENNRQTGFLSERLNRTIGWNDDDFDDFDTANKCNRKWSSNDSDSDEELHKNKIENTKIKSNNHSSSVLNRNDNDESNKGDTNRRPSNDFGSSRSSRSIRSKSRSSRSRSSRSHKSNVSRSHREHSRSVRKRSRSRDKRSRSDDKHRTSRDKRSGSRDIRSRSRDKRSRSRDKRSRSHERHTDKKKKYKKRHKRKDSCSESGIDSKRNDSKEYYRGSKTKRKKKDE